MDIADLPWPTDPPRHGTVVLRAFRDDDVAMVRDLATDPYVPVIGTLPAHADEPESLAYIARQRGRLAEGAGYSFAVADARTDTALGTIGLWLRSREAGRATIGYSVAPRARGRHVARDALLAVSALAWTLPELHRLEVYVEPWNAASLRTAEAAGFTREGLLRSHVSLGGRRRDMVLLARLRDD